MTETELIELIAQAIWEVDPHSWAYSQSEVQRERYRVMARNVRGKLAAAGHSIVVRASIGGSDV